MRFSSNLVENAVSSFAQLPGIGKRTALRLVLHLLKQPLEVTNQFATAIQKLRAEIKECQICHNLSDYELCSICNDNRRGIMRFLKDQELLRMQYIRDKRRCNKKHFKRMQSARDTIKYV